ncbi:hypothetical protein [Nocardioides piscis]|uniref:Type IV toxin-antitoxin system AbiEi family antitoxin domain-containing protein n=1 Tax=Nocardioides piscis TaxID=2714938 RepID=A0A6G7YFM3_9ACTN|nr:hypothetical protein [Nocardioides piscis]QIK75593.1 hypothetical protein G7071_09200 [Nocardioides piscis]
MLTEHRLPTGWPLPPDQPFTIHQARAARVDRRLPDLLRARVVRRPLRSVYVSSAVRDDLLLRAACLSLVMPAGCFVTDRCAGWLLGADMTLAPNEDVLLPRVSFFRPSDAGRLRNGLCVSGERAVDSDDLMEVHGVLTTTPLRTALDLGRLQLPDVALAGMDSVARLGAFEVEELVRGVGRLKGQRGVVQLRQLAPIVDAGSESFGESATRRRWHAADLPWPATQIPIERDGVVVRRVDLGLPELLFGVEYQGRRWHSSSADRSLDAARLRQLTERHGYEIELLDHTHVFGAEQDAEVRLQAAYERAKETFALRRRRIIF